MNPPTFSATVARTSDNNSDFADLLENSNDPESPLLATIEKLYGTGCVFRPLADESPPIGDALKIFSIRNPQLLPSARKWHLQSSVTTIKEIHSESKCVSKSQSCCASPAYW